MSNKPVIQIYTCDGDKRIENEILLGLEEEGILAGCTSINEEKMSMGYDELVKLCEIACEHSMFSCGVAINKKEIGFTLALHGSGVMMESYQNPTLKEARRLGSNAGRSIKGLPIKLIDKSEDEQ